MGEPNENNTVVHGDGTVERISDLTGRPLGWRTLPNRPRELPPREGSRPRKRVRRDSLFD